MMRFDKFRKDGSRNDRSVTQLCLPELLLSSGEERVRHHQAKRTSEFAQVGNGAGLKFSISGNDPATPTSTLIFSASENTHI